MTSVSVVDAQTTNAPAKPAEFSTFSKFISERNIFNPNRYARAANTRYKPKTTPVRRNSFGLVGTMSYDEGENAGSHAFFDGTSADFRKVLQPGSIIATFKVTIITPDSVTLVLETNSTLLKVGQQMRDDGRGHWALATDSVSFAANAGGSGRRGYNSSRDATSEATPPEGADANSTLEEVTVPDTGMEAVDATTPDAVVPEENAAPETVSTPGAPVSDALRRLMELRAQEEQSGNRN